MFQCFWEGMNTQSECMTLISLVKETKKNPESSPHLVVGAEVFRELPKCLDPRENI